ncbi:MAG: hypothetical protein OEW42_11250 [Acidimicrobiia bacterium]|nr:hypothetical protein [Acidimicrobiia bacterium]MDH5237399.1 hypothetical protein [Acidimicrobiia bacterium]
MLCERALEVAWGDLEIDPFTERHLRWCGRCRARHPQHEELRDTLRALRDALEADDQDRLAEIFAALDAIDRQRRQRTVAAFTGAAAAALVMAGTARRLVSA